MEKITKEELIEKMGGVRLSDDDLDKVSGGIYFDSLSECENWCINRSDNSSQESACVEQFCEDN